MKEKDAGAASSILGGLKGAVGLGLAGLGVGALASGSAGKPKKQVYTPTQTTQTSLPGQFGKAFGGVASQAAKSNAGGIIGSLSRAGSSMLAKKKTNYDPLNPFGSGSSGGMVGTASRGTRKVSMDKQASGIEKLAYVLAHGDIDFEKKTVSFEKTAIIPAMYGAYAVPEDRGGGALAAQTRASTGGALGGSAGAMVGIPLGALIGLIAGARYGAKGSQLMAPAGMGAYAGALAGGLTGGLGGMGYGAVKGVDELQRLRELEAAAPKTASPKRSAAFERAMKYLRK